jgi:hypothetical protein
MGRVRSRQLRRRRGEPTLAERLRGIWRGLWTLPLWGRYGVIASCLLLLVLLALLALPSRVVLATLCAAIGLAMLALEVRARRGPRRRR